MTDFVKWRSIGKFPDFVSDCRRNGIQLVDVSSKIKLHGTNGCIRVERDGFVASSRKTDLHKGTDNSGFRAFVETLKHNYMPSPITFYGEWAGPGIQKKDAATKLKEKHFFIFSAYIHGVRYIYDPEELQKYVDTAFLGNEDKNIHVLPWYSGTRTLNVLDDSELNQFITRIVDHVDTSISKRDPYIYEKFGVDGPGEGLVFYATFANDIRMFKVKTKEHSVNGKRKQVITEKPDGVDDFIETYVTENRMVQIHNEEFDGAFDMSNLGRFIGLVLQDTFKETKNEMELVDFTWKTVQRYAAPKIRSWFIPNCNKVT